MKPLAAVLFLIVSAASSADKTPGIDAHAVESEKDRRARQGMTRRLRSDPAAAQTLALRLMASSLGPQLAQSQDPSAAADEIQSWIKGNPESAAHLAIGFAQDDARGVSSFERSLYLRTVRYFELNPDRHKGLLGRLDWTARETKKMGALKGISDAERTRIMKDFFEGKGSARKKDKRTPTVRPAGGLYDRLNSANPTGYSPQVMAFQSAMNARGAPGAPRLIETGRLDHATLSYPSFGLRYDIANLQKTLEAQSAWAREKKLTLDLFFKKREHALKKAQDALEAFDREAEKTRKTSGITSDRLRALSARRREAARWIALASQAEKLARLRVLETSLLDKPLEAAIRRAPVESAVRDAYLAQGGSLRKRLRDAGVRGARALELLGTVSAPPAEDLAEADKILATTRRELRRLQVRVQHYRETPFKLLEHHASTPTSPARAWADRWAAKLLPKSNYGKKIRARNAKEIASRNAFLAIAAGR